MSTSENVLQLKQPGDGVTMRVTKCAPMKIGNFPEIEFVGVVENGETVAVRVPSKSADRQLERLDRTYQLIVGETITIARSPNAAAPAKPFWDIDLAEAIDAPQRVPNRVADAAPTRATPANSAPAQGTAKEKKRGAALYLELTAFVLDKVVPIYKGHGVTMTPEAIAVSVDSLYQQASQS